MAGEDERLMIEAIELGLRAQGKTGDNPSVGSVVVLAGQVIGRGSTGAPGENHAEVNALLAAEAQGFSVRGATVYSTVEPCAFFGRTPACAVVLAERRIARVVFGVRDPHPRVNGRGAALLRESGIEVCEGVCSRDITRYLSAWLGSHRARQ